MGLCGVSHIINKNKANLSKTNDTFTTNESEININKINKNNNHNQIKISLNITASIGEREFPIYVKSKSKIEIIIPPNDDSKWSFLPDEELTDFKGHKNYKYNNINIGCLLVRISSSKNYTIINKNQIQFIALESGSILFSANLDPNNYPIYKPKGSIRLIINGGIQLEKNKIDELTGYKYLEYDRLKKDFFEIYIEITRYINKVRSNIKKYINDFVFNFNENNFDLEENNDLPLIQIDNKLFEIAEEHCTFLCGNGTSGHIGILDKIKSNKNNIDENYAESIVFGLENPILIVNFLIIDKYSKKKENRNNLFNKNFSRIGISINKHTAYRHCCVIIFGK